jgi:Rap1a immunity proteins
VLLLFAFEAAQADSGGLSGNNLLVSCSNAVKFFDGDRSEPVVLSAPICIGFVQGFLAGMDAMLSKNLALYKKGLKGVACTEDAQTTVSQMVRILDKFLRDSPQNLHQPAGVLAMVAFSQAFPCKD